MRAGPFEGWFPFFFLEEKCYNCGNFSQDILGINRIISLWEKNTEQGVPLIKQWNLPSCWTGNEHRTPLQGRLCYWTVLGSLARDGCEIY